MTKKKKEKKRKVVYIVDGKKLGRGRMIRLSVARGKGWDQPQ
jgi:hypothetical protein